MTREPALPLGSYDPALGFTSKDTGSVREGCFSEGQSRSLRGLRPDLFSPSLLSLETSPGQTAARGPI